MDPCLKALRKIRDRICKEDPELADEVARDCFRIADKAICEAGAPERMKQQALFAKWWAKWPSE